MAAEVLQQPPASTSPLTSNQDVTSLQVTLAELLDFALGTPEVRAVNLHILHNFLHILLNEINLNDTVVEYHGDFAEWLRPIAASTKVEPNLYLQEYNIVGEDGEKVLRNYRIPASPTQEIISSTPKADGKNAVSSEIEMKNKVVPSDQEFKQLEDSVKTLEEKFEIIAEFSKTFEDLSGENLDLAGDVWQFVNINKRLDGFEEALNKLNILLRDVSQSETTVKGSLESNNKFSEFNKRLANLEMNYSQFSHVTNNRDGNNGKAIDYSKVTASDYGKANNDNDVEEISKLNPSNENQKATCSLSADFKANVDKIHEEILNLQNEVFKVQKGISNLQEKIVRIDKETMVESLKGENSSCICNSPATEPDNASNNSDEDDTNQPNHRNNCYCFHASCLCIQETPSDDSKGFDSDEKCSSREKSHSGNEKVDSEDPQDLDRTEQIREIERDVNLIRETLICVNKELSSKVKKLDEDFRSFREAMKEVIDDKTDEEVNRNALLEQIELLKTIKADKEDLEDALADKADARAVDRKVSHAQFDAACEDLARGVEDTIVKLREQELIWQEALNELQTEIEGKVDKDEIVAIKEFLNIKLKALQEKLKNLTEMKQESEAAGTKKKLLRDVQCISCDRNVVMKTKEELIYKSKPLYSNKSLKPYLTYKLDEIRKQPRAFKNLIHYENAVKDSRMKPGECGDMKQQSRGQICNRYCGGSHTVTTPQQRVMRVGQFLAQFSPETAQLTEGFVRGTDGRLYRSRPIIRTVCGRISTCSSRSQEDSEERQMCQQTAVQCCNGRKKIKGTQNTEKRKATKKSPSAKEVTETLMSPKPSPFKKPVLDINMPKVSIDENMDENQQKMEEDEDKEIAIIDMGTASSKDQIARTPSNSEDLEENIEISST